MSYPLYFGGNTLPTTEQHHDGGLLLRVLRKESNLRWKEQGSPCVRISAEKCTLLCRLEVRRKIEEVESCKVGSRKLQG